MFIGDESGYRKYVKRSGRVYQKNDDLEITNALQMINTVDFSSQYPSTEADKISTLQEIETFYPFKNYLNDAVCEFVKSGS